VIILGRCHDAKKQGARIKGGLSEWQIAGDVNMVMEHDIKYQDPCVTQKNTLVLEGTLGDRIITTNMLHKTATDKPDCIVECHCNSTDDPKAKGFFTMAWGGSDQSLGLAGAIGTSMRLSGVNIEYKGICVTEKDTDIPKLKRTRRWAGLTREYGGAPWLGLLTDTKCPAVIVEMCYLSNPKDAKWISKQENRYEMGRAIANGVIRWIAGGNNVT
jgi:hypothetical protein